MALPINNIKLIKLYYFTCSNSSICCIWKTLKGETSPNPNQMQDALEECSNRV